MERGLQGNDAHSDLLVAHTLRGEGHDASEDGTGRGVPLVMAYNAYQSEMDEAHATLTSETKGRGETGIMVFQSSQSGVRLGETHPTLDSHNGSRRHNGVVGFMPRRTNASAEHELSPTQSAGGGGFGSPGIADSLGVRRLTPLECERLQGFPDDWTVGQPDSARYKQCGNAVAVPCAEWIGRRIMQVVNQEA